MLKWLDSPKVLFGILRVAAVLAIAAGVWLSIVCGVMPTFTRAGGVAPTGVGYVVTALINRAVRNEVGLLITMLNFGIRQIALLLLISLAVAAIASYLPVRRIAAKRPIDAIRNR